MAAQPQFRYTDELAPATGRSTFQANCWPWRSIATALRRWSLMTSANLEGQDDAQESLCRWCKPPTKHQEKLETG